MHCDNSQYCARSNNSFSISYCDTNRSKAEEFIISVSFERLILKVINYTISANMKIMEIEGVKLGADDLGIAPPGSSDKSDHEHKMHKTAREYLDRSGLVILIREMIEQKPGEFFIEELSWDESASTNSTDDTVPQHPGNPYSTGLLISWDEKTKWENNMGIAQYSGIIIEAKVNGDIEVKGDIALASTILEVNSSTQEKNEAIQSAYHSPYLYERPIAGANEYGGGWLIV